MGRPERPLDPEAGPVQRFAWELRQLRASRGRPSYRRMAHTAHFAASTLADAAKGERLPSLEVTLAYVQACGGDVAEWRTKWTVAARPEAATAQVEPCPYQGLATFQPDRADWFFGRSKLVDRLLELVDRLPLVAVFGASGSGKSSLLRAGLLGSLAPSGASAAWQTILMTPTAHPREALATQVAKFSGIDVRHFQEELAQAPDALDIALRSALATGPEHTRVLLVVDQFEELFTLCTDVGERRLFLEALMDASHGPNRRTTVVLGIRADFLAHCSQYPALVSALENDAQLLVGAMVAADLREIVIQPAVKAKLTVHQDLVAAILADAADEPGALPLVSHALLETWRCRAGHAMSLADYHASGGMRGAIAQTAERVYGELTSAGQQAARRIFLRLTALGEGTEDTRRSIVRAELAGDAATGQVLNRLAVARLLVLDDGHVEVAHEAIIRAWPRLHRWLTDDRANLIIHRRLTVAARTWEELGWDTGALYRGAQLLAAGTWADDHPEELNQLEDRFLRASRTQESAEFAAAGRRTRLLKRLAAGMTALALLAAAGGCVAVKQRHDVRRQQLVALSRQLSLQARDLAATDPTTAGLLAVEAYNLHQTADSRGGLLSLAAVAPRIELNTRGSAVNRVDFSPDGSLLASANGDGSVGLWDPLRRTRVARLTGHTSAVVEAAFNGDGTLLVSSANDGSIIVWDVRARRTVTRFQEQGFTGALAVSRDGTKVAAGVGKGRIALLNVANRSRTLLSGHVLEVSSLSFNAEGSQLASADWLTSPMVWDADRGVRQATLPAPGAGRVAFGVSGRLLAITVGGSVVQVWDLDRDARAPVISLPRQQGILRAMSAPVDDRLIALAHEDGRVTVWDLPRREILSAYRDRGRTEALSVTLSRDGGMLASSGYAGSIILRNPAVPAFSGHTAPVIDVDVSPDGRTVASASLDQTVRLWDVRTGRPLAPPLTAHGGQTRAIAFSPDGRALAGLTRPHWITIWQAADRRTIHDFQFWGSGVSDIAFQPHGSTLAVAARVRLLWDIRRPTSPAPIGVGAATPARSLAFSPDGRHLVSTSPSTDMIVYDLVRRAEVRRIPTGREAIQDVAFSPDGKLIAVGGDNLTVQLWTAGTGSLVATLSGHSAPIQVLAFSTDGRRLASGSADHTIKIWNLATRQSTATLSGHAAPIQALTFAPDGSLFSGGDDNKIIRWRLDPPSAVSHICNAAGRAITRREWVTHIPSEPYSPSCHPR